MKYNKELARDFDNKEVIKDMFDLFVRKGLELCCADMIIRIDEEQDKVLSCEWCIYKGTEADILMCPYVWNSKIMRKVIC